MRILVSHILTKIGYCVILMFATLIGKKILIVMIAIPLILVKLNILELSRVTSHSAKNLKY